ncbi:MAG: hypothetical protein KatS3mg038_2517 [Candidatus Kapaibacterium sp.]|nr:MAG: hypothetical protein KatS3mg038_2517 [Candidatus Kapabacteria bacterium]
MQSVSTIARKLQLHYATLLMAVRMAAKDGAINARVIGNAYVVSDDDIPALIDYYQRIDAAKRKRRLYIQQGDNEHKE